MLNIFFALAAEGDTTTGEIAADITFFEQKLRDFANVCAEAAYKLVAAIAVFLVGILIIKFLIKRVSARRGFLRVDVTVKRFTVSFLRIVLYTMLLISVVAIMGVPMSSVIAVIASAGVAIGLALQGSLSNLAGGIMILLFKPFRVGDYIESGDIGGTVEEVSLFYTILLNPTNQRINVPNAALSNTKVINYSVNDTRRLDLIFSLPYGSDNNTVIGTIMAVVNSKPAALKTPAPFLRMTEYSASALIYTLNVWCQRGDFLALKCEILEDATAALERAGFCVPYQTLNVNLKDSAGDRAAGR